MKIERILMPTDFSTCAQAAFDRALAFAKEHDAELHVLHVIELHASEPASVAAAFPDLEEIHERLDALAAGEMGKLLAAHRGHTLVIQEAVRRGVDAAPAVVDYAVEQGIDLIVIGTHGRRGLRRLLLGSVAEEVVRTAPCPVLTVRGERPAAALTPFARLVVPHDFSDDSDHALALARALVPSDGRVDVLHVIAPPLEPDLYAPLRFPHQSFSFVALHDEAEKLLAERLGAGADDGAPIALHVLEGHAASVIADFAEQNDSDLVVIGSHGSSGLRRFLLGSVAAGVVRAAPCAVLTVRGADVDPRT